MKKNILLLLLSSALLAGCATEFSYIPRKGGKYVPFEEETDEEALSTDRGPDHGPGGHPGGASFCVRRGGNAAGMPQGHQQL